MMEKLQPKLRFPEFNIPWKNSSIRDLTTLVTKGTTPKKFSKNGVNYIKIECLDGSKIDSNKCLFINEDIHTKELKRSILKENDILFAIAGATIGKCVIVNSQVLPANTNQALSIIRLKSIENIDFVYQILTSEKMRKYILDNISVGAQPNLNLEQINAFSFNTPSLPEQQKIASFLTTVDDKISNLKQKVSLLEKYKKGVMQQIFSQQIRFKDENGNDYPEWEAKSLGEVCEFYSGGTPLTTNKNFYNGHIPFIKSGEIGEKETKQFITELGLKNSSAKLVSKGDILYALYGATSGEVSISQINGAINQAVLCIKSSQNQVYLFQYLKCQKDNIVSTYIQGGQGNLSANIIKELNVALPSINEQTKIAEFLSGIDKKIETTKLQLSKMEVWKKGLLQGMFC